MGKSAKVSKSFSTGGVPGVSGSGSNFQNGKVTIASPRPDWDAHPGGQGAIGNSGGIPAGAK